MNDDAQPSRAPFVSPGMSVAFRRESDEEHREPRPELPVPPGPNLVTARGLALIEARVAGLEAGLATAIGEEAIAALKRDLRYWHVRRATAQPTLAADPAEAGFGMRVRYLLNGSDYVVSIVGDDEADPGAGSISFASPLARALAGAGEGEGEGDRVDFAGKADAITILGVEPL